MSKLALVVGVLLIVAGSITYHRYRSVEWFAPPPREPDPAVQARAAAIRDIDFHYSWRPSGIGTPMRIDVVLTNNGAHDVRGIDIACEHRSASGARLDVNRAIYWGVVKTSETLKINDLDMGLVRVQAASAHCYVKDLEVLKTP
ncbi:MAG: hypothetical protein ACK4N4_00635 [Burkholderiales bacterium]